MLPHSTLPVDSTTFFGVGGNGGAISYPCCPSLWCLQTATLTSFGQIVSSRYKKNKIKTLQALVPTFAIIKVCFRLIVQPLQLYSIFFSTVVRDHTAAINLVALVLTFVNITMMYVDYTSNHLWLDCHRWVKKRNIQHCAALVPIFVNIHIIFADCTSNHLWLDQFLGTGLDNCQHFSSIGAHLCQLHIQSPLAGLGTGPDNCQHFGAHLCKHKYDVCRLPLQQLWCPPLSTINMMFSDYTSNPLSGWISFQVQDQTIANTLAALVPTLCQPSL